MRSICFLLCFVSLTACNTVAGLGRDIQKSAEYTSTMFPEKESKEK